MREDKGVGLPVLHSESLVYLIEEKVWAKIVGAMGAYYSTVTYNKGGIDYEVLVENEDFVLWEDLIEYDD